MLLRMLVVVGLAGYVSLFSNTAAAQSAAQPPAIEGVNLADPTALGGGRFDIQISDGAPARFTNLNPLTPRATRSEADTREYELALVTRTGAGMDVALAQRGGFGFDAAGDVARESRSAELRLGRGLTGMRRDAPSSSPRWYLFAASEDEALVWQPGRQRNAFGGAAPSFALQDRVEIGDIQAGVTYEIYGLQASLAYVEREISVHSGAYSFSEDQRFAGFTLTMRR